MLYGHELLFRGSQFGAVATVEPKPGACVPVLVWKLRPSDERALDLYEGYPHLPFSYLIYICIFSFYTID